MVAVLPGLHRYYGDSQPFPSALQPDGTLNSTALYKWLTVEQVIEDTAAVVAAVRRELDVPTAVPAIVIGGESAKLVSWTLLTRTCCSESNSIDQATTFPATRVPFYTVCQHDKSQGLPVQVGCVCGFLAL